MSKYKKYIFLASILIGLIPGTINAQEIQVSTGFGYYDPQLYKGEGSNIFFTSILTKLPTEYYIGLSFGMSDIYTEFDEDDQLFGGFRSIQNYYHFSLLLKREFNLGKGLKHYLRPGTGITYQQLRFAEPFITITEENGSLLIEPGINQSDRQQDDAGVLITFDYEYRFNRIGIGLHNEVHILLNIGFGGFVIAPMLSFSF